MGYTHYYHTYDEKKKRITKTDRNWVLPILRDIVDRYKDILTGDGMGETRIPVVLNNTEIWLNGIGDDSHETFWFPMNSLPHKFTFCKTARKPYDAPVSEMLIVLKYHFRDLFVASDGFSRQDAKPEHQYLDDEWIVAAREVKQLYGIETQLFHWEEKPVFVSIPTFSPILPSVAEGRRNLIRPKPKEIVIPENETGKNIKPGCLPGLF